MPGEVLRADLHVAAAVRLEGRHRRHEHDRARLQAAGPGDDVHHLLEAHVRAEAALGHEDVGELEPDEVGDDRVVARRDVGERARVDERRLALERLDQVRPDRVAEKHRHRAGRLERARGDGLAVAGAGDRDRREPPVQVVDVAGDGDDRHHLGGGRDVEAGLARNPVGLAAEPDHDVAQRAVVHVEAAAPGDRQRVDVEVVAVHQVRVEHRRQQVVRGADRVDVAGEVEVQLLHRHDLRVAAARAAALDPEDGAEGRLAQRDRRTRADPAERLGEADRRGRLALARLGRGDRRDADELAGRGARAGARARSRSIFAFERP